MCTAPETARLEVATLLRRYGEAYRERHHPSADQARAVRAIEACRTEAMGGHVQACDRCGALALRYHSCRDRHCPKCQTLAKERWVEARRDELLATRHDHVVFTLPHALNPLIRGNPRRLYGLLFAAAADTLLAFGRDPRWIGGEIGVTLVLHTWGQNLGQHVHVHGLVTAGGLSPDGRSWLPAKQRFLFPVRALSRVFRGKYLELLARAHRRGDLAFGGSTAALADPRAFARFVATLRRAEWVVYAKPPFAGPEQVVAYLGRYTHRVAIGNDRLVTLEDDRVAFRWRDYRDGARCKVMRLEAVEFIRRFLLHVLPRGFVRVRHYGLFANRQRRARLARCRELLAQPEPEARPEEDVAAMVRRLTGRDILACPHCGEGRLRVSPSSARDGGRPDARRGRHDQDRSPGRHRDRSPGRRPGPATGRLALGLGEPSRSRPPRRRGIPRHAPRREDHRAPGRAPTRRRRLTPHPCHRLGHSIPKAHRRSPAA